MIIPPLLAAVAACWPSFVALHKLWVDWQQTSHTHGYLIVAIVAWLLWHDRGARSASPTGLSWTKLLPLLGAAAVWLIAVLASIQFVEFAVLPVVLWTAVLAACGWIVARRVAFPLGFLWFATPLPDAMNPLFQWTSIYSVRFALRLFGIPAYFDENQVQIPEGTFEIAGGCSGLHFAVVGSAIALLLGKLRGDHWRGRLLLLSIALTLSALTNWIRIFVIIVAGHATHMQHYLVARSHYTFGWVVFAAMMIVFFLIERQIPVRTEATHARETSLGAVRQFEPTWQLAALVVMGMMTAWRLCALRPAVASLQDTATPAGWNAWHVSDASWRPRFEGADETRFEALSRNGIRGLRFRALYRSQRQGKELDGYDNDPFAGLSVVGETADSGNPGLYRVRDAQGQESVAQVVFRVGDKTFTSARTAQLHYALRALLDRRSPASVVQVLRVTCESGCGAAMETLRELGSQS